MKSLNKDFLQENSKIELCNILKNIYFFYFIYITATSLMFSFQKLLSKKEFKKSLFFKLCKIIFK